MKKTILYILIVFITSATQAQKGNNQLKIMAETGISGNRIGYGAYLKGLYGVIGSGQLSLTTGMAQFRSESPSQQTETTIRLIPVLAGYKKNIGKFYAEPQVGYGDLSGKIKSDHNFDQPSTGAFFWAIGAGYDNRRFSLGIRYQEAQGIKGVVEDTWENKNFHYFGINACYTLLGR